MTRKKHILPALAVVSALVPLALGASATDASKAAVQTGWQKPAWLTDLSFGVKESYDNNLWLVANENPGLSPQASWVTTLSPKIGINLAPLLGGQKTFQTLSLVYSPDFAYFHSAPSENFNAHKIGSTIKGKSGDFSFSLDNAFLFNDGSSVAPTYAVAQTAAALEADKCRSVYATAYARERREQIQNRATVTFQYDVNKFFVRPTAQFLYYDLMTDWHNAAVAPYIGYQDYVDRWDLNGGADLGYRMTKDLAVTIGYRYGHQYQQALPSSADSSSSATVNGQRAQSSSDYQRILLGIEGKPWKWLNAKLAIGPDFRNYNSAAPIGNDNYSTYYGEALLSATLTPDQTLTFTYKQWQWVSGTGKVPYFDSTYALAYHWNATKKLGIDLGGKFLESDYTSGSASLTGNSSLRDDAQYTVSAGVSYAFTPNLSASFTYNYDFGRNLQNDLPNTGSAPTLAATAGYREYDHQQVSLGMVFKF